ncbi:centrosomal protein of 104 kDa-like isoform X2 [Vombatus ursinus]|uniref:Centrosomal protein of 104 kDa n=1 Tax=Vombatus ursinus TaxID=29139 RepID=A0A4X2MBH3_VOMUR|nr:centrosomal protein of 104 kDa isoform X2 [Vombatus ursinus]XP_027699703.1 centrosomal protein of 104 kDa-like isoform X2 [Vombatus ursinus]
MPHKIGFIVVSSSGHEDGFSAKELMVHAPTVNGWRSPRFCQFPQEIVLQMVERCRVRKLQLLAHQYMISSKIEFYISDSLPEYFAPYQAERFRRLGYVSLCDNEKTGCKARELKSVYVDAVGQFLKLIFHKNHVNRYNLYSQVALVAVNIIGDPEDCSDESNISSREKLIDHYLGQSSEDSGLEGSYVGKTDYISPLDDLAFDMYQDPEVAQIIRRLDEKKREAVQKERYDHAKKLKQAIADLQKVGERLGRYDVEKRCAVEKEDYDLAKEKKQQMEQYRSKVYQQLQLHNLLDSEMVDLLPYDERPLPAVLKQQGETNVEPEKVEEDVSVVPKGSTVGEPEPLTEKALREASSAIEVLGETLVAGAYSKTWSYREDALLSLYNKIMTVPVGTSKEDLKSLLRATIFLIRRAIKDLVPSVFQASLKLLKMIITQYIPKHKLGKPETTLSVEKTLPNLLTRTGDSSARLRIIASNFIQELALCKEIKPLQIIPTYLVQPLKQNSSTHLAMSQTDLLARLLKDLGTETSGFTVDNVMRFSVSALEHRIYEIREIAIKIILDMYKKHRTLILEYLPADDGNTRKNVLYKTLFEGFAKIDGKATVADVRAQKKAATEEAEKQKKEEIKVLQVQLAALREIQAEAEMEKDKESDTRKVKNQDDPQRKAGHPNAPEVPDDHTSVGNYLDFLCIFCGERDDSFTEEGLDLHYWKHCPMLTRCEHCKQVVEIASLTEHLLTECDKRDEFGKCHRCCEAILKEELPKHIKIKACNPARSEKLANRCPLCHENFTPGEEAWKSHLTGPAGCTMNLRKAYYLQKTQATQLGKAVDSVMAKSGTSGSKFGSKIPTPKGGLNKSTSRAYTKR